MIKPRNRVTSGSLCYSFDEHELEYKNKTYYTAGDLWVEYEAKWYDGEWIVDWVPEGIKDLTVYDDNGEEADLHNDRIFRADLTRDVSTYYEDDIEIEILNEIGASQ